MARTPLPSDGRQRIVQSASGNVTTTASGQTGEYYVISTNQSLDSTFADIDAE